MRQERWRMWDENWSSPLISVLKLGPAFLFLAHRWEIDGLPIRKYQLVLLIIHEAVLLLLPLLLVALDSSLVRVFTSKSIRIDVSVFAACYAIHADRLLLVRSVVVLEAPRYGTVRVVVSISPDDLSKDAFVNYISHQKIFSRLPEKKGEFFHIFSWFTGSRHEQLAVI